MSSGRAKAARRALLRWYEPRRLAYPWRRRGDPYAVLVSEVMLQQTQAARVAPAFERFLAGFPTLASLAAAPRSDVVRAWDGLGYNRRAVSLSLAAREIVTSHGGVVPRDPTVLRSLPGVGPYTAAAVASIGYGERVPAVDTNARRVVRRAIGGRDDLDATRIDELALAWLDAGRPGDWNQAVMDLGRTFCRPRPTCGGCPIRAWCAFACAGAVAMPSARRQAPFAGSGRQVRGDVVRVLRRRAAASIAELASATGHPIARVHDAVSSLTSDGIVHADVAGAEPFARDRVRLAG